MKAKKNKSSAEKLVEEVLVEADQLTEITENMVREQLSELFSPNVKRAINKVITEGSGKNKYEGEEVSDDDLEDLERALEEGDDEDEDEDWNFEEDGGEGDSDGEGDEEYDDESMEESDYSDELEDEEDLDEETPANYDEDDYDFIEELREILEADDEEDDFEDDVDMEDMEDLDEGEDGGSYTEKAPKVKMDEEEEDDGKSDDSSDLSEDKEGGSYTEKAPKVKMDEEELAEVLAENKRYKSALRKAVKSLKEANLDSKKMNAVERIISERKVGERGKLRITSAIDKAKNEKDILVLESALSRQYPKRKKSVQESKKRSLANKGRRQKPAKKSIKESKADIIAPFGKRMAEIAGISKNK